MEKHERYHITSNLSELINLTFCNVSCTSILIQEGVLSDDDKAELDAIPNERKKTEKLYEILLKRKGSYSHLISALDEGLQSGALAILHNLEENADGTSLSVEGKIDTRPSKRRKRDKVPILFDVLAPVLNFTGREPQLFELHRKLQENVEKRAVISQMASIVGLGGIGKTELARKYIQVYGDEFYEGNVVWISAQSEETLGESFRRLASNHLNISLINKDKKEMDISTIVGKVYDHFNRQRVLFVFDNAESTEHLLKFMPFHLSPTSENPPYILITSRDREWSFSVPVLELDEMTEEDTIMFVKKSLRMENDDDNEEIMKLVNRLQRYPLALSQAVSFIKQRQLLRNFSITEYLDKFEENSEKLLDSKKPPAEFNSYKETTLTTWRVTTQQISSDEENGRLAVIILYSVSYFLPDKIPMRIFAILSDGDEYQEALQLLFKYSMLNVQKEDKTVSVHRLVQHVTRIQLKRNNLEEIATEMAWKLISCSVKYWFGDDLVYHLVSAYKFCCVLNPELSVEFKHFPWEIVGYFIKQSRSDEGESVGKDLDDLLSKNIPSEDPDLIRLKLGLVYTAYNSGKSNLEAHLEELEKLHKKYVENKENSFSQEELLSLESFIVLHLRMLRHFQEALQLSRKIVEQQITLAGLNHWRTIDTLLSSLSDEDWSEYITTISFMREAYESKLVLVGKDVEWTQTIVRIADFLYDTRDRENASKILEYVIMRTTKSQDKRFHRIVRNCLLTLARIKEDQEKYDAMLAISQSLHSQHLTWKGKTHKLTLLTQVNVSRAFLKLGELEKAVQTYADILKILETKRELPHHDFDILLLQTYEEIVNIFCKMETSEVNLQRFVIMKAKMETEFGESHPLLEIVENQINLFTRDNSETVTHSRKYSLVLIPFIILGLAIFVSIYLI